MATGEQIIEQVTGEVFLASGGEVDICEECCEQNEPCNNCLGSEGPSVYQVTFSGISLCAGCFGSGGHFRFTVTAGDVNGVFQIPFAGVSGDDCDWFNIDTGLRGTLVTYSNAGCVSVSGTWTVKGTIIARWRNVGFTTIELTLGYQVERITGPGSLPSATVIFIGVLSFPWNPHPDCFASRVITRLPGDTCSDTFQTALALGGTGVLVAF